MSRNRDSIDAPVPRPVLYSFRRCPYAIRARLALRYAGVEVALREVVLRDKPQALRDASPKATVPVLCLPDGRVLEHSLHIMVWALQACDPEGWLGTGDAAEGQALITRNDGPFKTLLDKYKYPQRARSPEGDQRSQSDHRDEAVALLLHPLEERLQNTRFLLADRVSLADIALVPFVRQFASVDPEWFTSAPLPALRRWRDQLVSSALFDAVMLKYEAWQPGDVDTLF